MVVSESEVPPVHDGGLLNLPALFALADFHLFSVIYAALSCAAMSTFAGYSAPRVHQEFVIAILPRTGLELLPVSS
jgi:nucleoside permease NupC